MPTPCRFERSVELDAPVEVVFAFHGDPHNVGKISPRWQKITVEQGEATPREGAEFEIVIRFFGLVPMRWRGVWQEVATPERLVDGAITGPFVYWKHRHEFRAIDSRRTRMTDHVEYLFPGGWLGKWFGETLGRVQFQLMFADRHARTKRWMHEHGQAR